MKNSQKIVIFLIIVVLLAVSSVAQDTSITQGKYVPLSDRISHMGLWERLRWELYQIGRMTTIGGATCDAYASTDPNYRGCLGLVAPITLTCPTTRPGTTETNYGCAFVLYQNNNNCAGTYGPFSAEADKLPNEYIQTNNKYYETYFCTNYGCDCPIDESLGCGSSTYRSQGYNCADNTMIRRHLCTPTGCDTTPPNSPWLLGPNGYSYTCVSSDFYPECASTPPVTCSETDGGEDYELKGTTTIVGGVRDGTYTDDCISGTNSYIEYWCDGSADQYGQSSGDCSSYKPGYICQNGRCIPPSTLHICTGPSAPDFKTQSYTFYDFNPLPDTCLDQDIVRDYYCPTSSTLAQTDKYCSDFGPGWSCSGGICIYSQQYTCSDGIQNQGETGIDCGGPCTACPTCSDSIQNQGETGIDCGGPCTACVVAPTCSDGIQNQGETGIDCGGPCPPCGVPVTCVDDDDGGKNYGNFGKITITGGTSPGIFPDVCNSNTALAETFCDTSASKKGIDTVTCSTVIPNTECKNGACVPIVNTCNPVGAADYTIKKSISYNGQTLTDTCQGTTSVHEYSCPTSSTKAEVDFLCSSLGDYECVEGACKPKTATHTCVGIATSDPKKQESINYDSAPLFDNCVIGSTDQLIQYTCKSGTEKLESTISCASLGNYECKSGACVQKIADNTCAGKTTSDPKVLESVRYNGVQIKDVCTTTDSLTEYQCSSPSVKTSTITSCSVKFGAKFVCKDGACFDSTGPEIITCSETDAGNNPFDSGITTINGGAKKGDYTDFCISDSLTEYSCDESAVDKYSEKQMICGDLGEVYSCKDGACTESIDPTKTCADNGGGICSGTTSCSDQTVITSDTDKCCLASCVDITKSCAANLGKICDLGKSCSTATSPASDTNQCCFGECFSQDDTCSDNNGKICASGTKCSKSLIRTSDTSYCCTGACNDVSLTVPTPVWIIGAVLLLLLVVVAIKRR